MSDRNRPGDVPPELPPEYADAYRRGYQRAYEQAGGDEEDTERTLVQQPRPLFADEVDPTPEPEPEPGRTREPEPEPVWTREPAPQPVPVGPEPSQGAHRGDPEPLSIEEQFEEYDPEFEAEQREPGDRPAWLVPALLAGLVVVLLLGAYVVGRLVSSNLSGTPTAQDTPSGVVINEDGSTGGPSSPAATHKPVGKKYAGSTSAAAIGGASATCQSSSGVDSAGHKVAYDPGNVYDQDLSTAWRCDGDGAGQRLTVNLDGATKIGEVGLIPGYAKTDPRSGVDRYAENNRITKVRWLFDDGTAIEQTFDPSPADRSMQTMRIPVTKSSKVVVEVLGSHPGPRDTIAVSEVRIGKASG